MNWSMKKPVGFYILFGGALLISSLGGAPSRIKDVARFQGDRENQLIGYGLVVGLDGTGDSRQTFFTTQTLTNLLNRQGITIPSRSIQITNTAAVMVTAVLPAFARTGTRIDVTTSSIGDADSFCRGEFSSWPSCRRATDKRMWSPRDRFRLGGSLSEPLLPEYKRISRLSEECLEEGRWSGKSNSRFRVRQCSIWFLMKVISRRPAGWLM